MAKEYPVGLTLKEILQIIKEMTAYEDTEGESKQFWRRHEEIIEKLEDILKKKENKNPDLE